MISTEYSKNINKNSVKMLGLCITMWKDWFALLKGPVLYRKWWYSVGFTS